MEKDDPMMRCDGYKAPRTAKLRGVLACIGAVALAGIPVVAVDAQGVPPNRTKTLVREGSATQVVAAPTPTPTPTPTMVAKRLKRVRTSGANRLNPQPLPPVEPPPAPK